MKSLHLQFKNYGALCTCINATDEFGEIAPQYLQRLFADVLSDYNITLDESITYFLADGAYWHMKCRMTSGVINLYINEI